MEGAGRNAHLAAPGPASLCPTSLPSAACRSGRAPRRCCNRPAAVRQSWRRRSGAWQLPPNGIGHISGITGCSQPQHLVDPVRPGGDHRQPVEAERDPRGRRHAVGQGGQEILVQRPVRRAVQRMAAGPVGHEAGALLGGVGEFHEGVGQFDAADEQLEPLGDARVGRVAPGQRRLRRRPVGQEGRLRAAEMRLDRVPAAGGRTDPPRSRRRAAAPRPAAASAGASPAVASRSAPTWRANASATVRRSTARGRCVTPRQVTTGGSTARSSACVSAISSSMPAPGRYHSSMVNSARVQVAALAVAPHPGELEDRPGAAHQQLLHGEFRAGVQPQRFAARRPGATRSVAKAADAPPRPAPARRRAFPPRVAARGEERAHRGGQQRPPAQERQACGEALRVPGGDVTAAGRTAPRPPPPRRRRWRPHGHSPTAKRGSAHRLRP